MTIITNDGVTIQGTPEAIVTALREGQRLEVASDNRTYMASVASRVRLWDGAKLAYGDAAQFLTGLQKAELIDILDA
jgi:hypothetical protein